MALQTLANYRIKIIAPFCIYFLQIAFETTWFLKAERIMYMRDEDYKVFLEDLRFSQIVQMIVCFTFNVNSFLLNLLVLPIIILIPHAVLYHRVEGYNESTSPGAEVIAYYFLTMIMYLHQRGISKIVIQKHMQDEANSRLHEHFLNQEESIIIYSLT
jgi:hypothetical protein